LNRSRTQPLITGNAPARNRLAYGALLATTAYAVLLWSPQVLGQRLPAKLPALMFMLPWLLLWPACGWRTLTDRGHRPEIVLMGLIGLLGAANVWGSDHPHRTFQALRVFFYTGLPALWTAMLVCRTASSRAGFARLCGACLAVVVGWELAFFVLHSGDRHYLFKTFTLHQIPTGTLVILLLPGPFALVTSRSRGARAAGGAAIAVAVGLILLTQKRGTILALAAMAGFWLWVRRPRLGRVLLALCVAAALILPVTGRLWIPALHQDNPSHFSLLHRLELYPFAWHVFRHRPWGMGLRPFTHERYLDDYEPHFPQFTAFAATVKDLQTFDNLAVTAVVELGPLFTLAYAALIFLILRRYLRQTGPLSRAPPADALRLVPLLGLAVHALTYDALLFPPINWLCHVHLGLLAGFAPEND